MIYLSFFDIDERVIKASEKAMELCKDKLAEIDDIQAKAESCTWRN